MSQREIDDVSGVDTTGHEWDGIKELNNPLPRWWVWTFYITIVWALAYTIAYPAWPLITSATGGVLGYSSRVDVKRDLAEAEAARADYAAAVASKTVEEIMADDGLRVFAEAAGSAAFRVNCVQCHGSGAAGSSGFPNLNDDDWLWGGAPADIGQTIRHGIRFVSDPDTRVSEMPAFADILKPEEILSVAAFTATLSGLPVDAARAQSGRELFAQNCASCHGPEGKGGREFGAPDLTDAITLYVRTPADIARQIARPRNGVMPAWGARLGETTVKELTVYVHSLGGGEQP